MIVSNDRTIRMVGSQINQVPDDKNEVTNESFANSFCKCGPHQVHLDISRCTRLSPVRTAPIISIGQSLLYLDISYTKILDISVIATNCQMLKAINLAGLELSDRSYGCLHDLVSLEVVSVRSSNITDINVMSNLPCLRSLDLGETYIATIDPLRCLTRLEELLLDNSNLTDFDEPEDKCDAIFRGMSSLRLLNFNCCMPPLPESIIVNSIDHEVYIEPINRRQLFFEAIADKNLDHMYMYLTNGQDINMRARPEDATWALNLWNRKCATPKLRTPFFLVDHPNENCRPAAIHFAIMFNAFDIIVALMDAGADINYNVWFSDVKEFGGKLIENEALSQKQLVLEFNSKLLVKNTFERNVHRITEELFQNKVVGWKAITTHHNKLLSALLETEKSSQRYTLLLAKQQSSVVRSRPRTAASTTESVGNEKKDQEATDQSKQKDENNMEETAGEELADNGLIINAIFPTTAKGAGSKLFRGKQLPRKQKQFEWRQHGMVQKLVGKARLLHLGRFEDPVLPPIDPKSRVGTTATSSVYGGDSRASTAYPMSIPGTAQGSAEQPEAPALIPVTMPLLGKTSYWLEGRKQTASAKGAIVDKILREREEEEELKNQQQLAFEYSQFSASGDFMATTQYPPSSSPLASSAGGGGGLGGMRASKSAGGLVHGHGRVLSLASSDVENSNIISTRFVGVTPMFGGEQNNNNIMGTTGGISSSSSSSAGAVAVHRKKLSRKEQFERALAVRIREREDKALEH